MEPRSPSELRQRLAELPAGRPLLDRLGDREGVYLVGGAVRDLLLGDSPTELDLVVEGDAETVAERLGGAAQVHDRFGTSTVHLDGHRYDLARARRETYARPGALPEVEPAALADDLRRRDFTVNAIALGLSVNGRLEAVPGALEDLEARRLRVLHDRSFLDDPTRLLRLARYAGRLSFEVDPNTLELAGAAVAGGALQTVSGARLGAELRLLAREPDPVAALESLWRLGLDSAIHPGFGLTDSALARRALELLPADGRPELLVLAAAARGVPAAELAPLLDRLAFEARDRQTIVASARDADVIARALGEARQPSEIAAAVAGGSPELVALAGATGPADAASEWLERLRDVELEIDGNDLIAAGVPSGPRVGRGLRAALAAKLDGHTAGRDGELAVALEAAGAEP